MPFTKGHHPPTEFTSDNAREMQERSVASRIDNAEARRRIDENLHEVLAALTDDSKLADFARRGKDARNQFQRIYGLDLSNPKTARAALNEILDRIKGRPAKTVNLGNADGNPFGITVNDQATADHIAGVLDEFNK